MRRAQSDALIYYPWLSHAILSLELVEDQSVSTATTDGMHIRFNPKFVAPLSTSERLALMLHEVAHCVLLHPHRLGSRDLEKANKSMDYAVNDLLIEAGLPLPTSAGLYDPKFHGMPWEQIYDMLPDDTETSLYGEVSPAEVEEKNQSDAEGKWQEISASVAEALRAQAHTATQSATLDRIMRAISAPTPLSLYAALERFVSHGARTDWSFLRPSRRHLHLSDVRMPTLDGRRISLGIAIDTSGSIDRDQLDYFCAILDQIRRRWTAALTVVYADSEVCGEQIVRSHERLSLSPTGGGGTDYRPALTYFQNSSEVSAVIYLTDGQCDSFGNRPTLPVFWTVLGRPDFTPPFGEVFYLKTRS